MNLANLLRSVLFLFYPPLCVGCSDILISGEKFFCSECLSYFPKKVCLQPRNNPSFNRLSALFCVQRATSCFEYSKGGGIGKNLVVAIKYHGNISAGEWIGAYIGHELLPSGFFDGIDYLVPVPLHKKRRWKRGFNQSEILAKSISSVTDIPVDTHVLYRNKNNVSQTKKDASERQQNIRGIFQVKDTAFFKDKHLLLIDDVLTTGSTLKACAQVLSKCENVRISVLTLAIA
jgi:ComF family protein